MGLIWRVFQSSTSLSADIRRYTLPDASVFSLGACLLLYVCISMP